MKIERTIELPVPVAKVWDAIIDYRKFGEWFRCKLDQPFEEGKESTGMMTYPGTEHIAWQARVIKIIPEKCLEFSWPPYVENAAVNLTDEPWLNGKFKLQAIPGGTLLTISESGFEKLSPAIREDALRGNEQGWEIQAGHILEYVTN